MLLASGRSAMRAYLNAPSFVCSHQYRQKGRQEVTHPDTPDVTTSPRSEGEALKAIVRRNTEQVQGQGDFALFDELFADDFVDHTPSPAPRPTKPVFVSSTTGCATRFPTSDPRFIGKPSTATSSLRTRSTTAPTSATFSASPRPVRPSNSKRSTRCEFATGRSPTTGGWRTCTPSCNNSDNYRPPDPNSGSGSGVDGGRGAVRPGASSPGGAAPFRRADPGSVV